MVMFRCAAVYVLTMLVGLAGVLGADPPPAAAPAAQPSVFDLPMLKALHVVTEGAVAEFFARGEYEKAAKLLEQAVQRIPQDFNAHYNLACALGRLGKNEEAIAHLQKAVELGFRDAKHVESDEDLANLRKDKVWTPAKITHQILNGGQKMPAFSDALTDAEISQLVAYLRAKRRPAPPPAPSPGP